jgi:phosphate:Na+ symporter
MIRSGQLAPTIATSMMNDESYAFDICDNLIEASEALLQPGTPEDEAMEDRLALDDEDIQRIADRKSETKEVGRTPWHGKSFSISWPGFSMPTGKRSGERWTPSSR